MKSAVFAEKGSMKLVDVDKPTIQKPDDVIIRGQFLYLMHT